MIHRYHPLISLVSSGDVGVYSGEPLEDEDAKAAALSLQAFVSYHRLYRRWWSNSAQDASAGVAVNGAEAPPPTGCLDELDFDATLLLSEPHAAYQATQRTVGQLQERLAAMVLQHSRSQGEQQETASTAES